MKYLIFFIALIAGIHSYGQTSNENTKYLESLKQKEIQRKKELVDYCRKNNIPMEKTDSTGKISYLHHIDASGRPVYYSTRTLAEEQAVDIRLDQQSIPLKEGCIYSFSKTTKELAVTSQKIIRRYSLLSSQHKVIQSRVVNKKKLTLSKLSKYLNLKFIIIEIEGESLVFEKL
jgi:hypothetical protein